MQGLSGLHQTGNRGVPNTPQVSQWQQTSYGVSNLNGSLTYQSTANKYNIKVPCVNSQCFNAYDVVQMVAAFLGTHVHSNLDNSYYYILRGQKLNYLILILKNCWHIQEKVGLLPYTQSCSKGEVRSYCVRLLRPPKLHFTLIASPEGLLIL